MRSSKVSKILFPLLVIFCLVLSLEAFGQEIGVMTTETDPKSVKLLKKSIAEFEAANPGVKVRPEFLSFDDMLPRLVSSIAAKNPPAVVGVEGVILAQLYGRGWLRSVDNAVDKLGRGDFYPQALDLVTFKGKAYGAPYALGMKGFHYRADLFKKKGLKPPQTWNDLLKNAKALTEDRNGDGKIDMYGIALPVVTRHTNGAFWQYLWTNGGEIFDKNGKIVLDKSPNLERAVEVLEMFWQKLAKYAPPGMAQYGFAEVRAAYYRGLAAQAAYGARILVNAYDADREIYKNTRWVPLPKGPHGSNASYLGSEAWISFKGTKYPDLADKFIAFMMTGDRILRWLHTVPLHLMPSMKSIGKSARYRAHPIIQGNLGYTNDWFGAPEKSDFVWHPYQMIGNTVILDATMVLDTPPIREMVQKVYLKKAKPRDAVREAAQRLRDRGIGKKIIKSK
jgi:ABC-type glycerol-3-phosphate transport system substrate-binding protein